MGEHRRFQADLSKKLKLMQAAVAALPEVRPPPSTRHASTPPPLAHSAHLHFPLSRSQELRAAAMRQDLALMPSRRQIPLATPNIEGYYEGKQREAEQAAGLGGAKRR